ncbi:4-oxalomesaconate tautomerase [Paenarthrobacter sp. TYUT067]|uniref:4-oxalomesaconate tautomerase n=1 Tax=Paenarthrobacter sp. TYUT067 TaxID=2926245 RepID=UPI00202FAB43|nr:4-oxalomesaconate tautomerase [Paenarthrobacter sp. TYUT067]MCM0618557.1 4-oxalomesaconate tautomerase [Paenarthrobacter sp. TYUT067]
MNPETHGTQWAIPCWFMRGGTSKGPFFRGSDLPAAVEARDSVLLAAMGSPDPRQIDGLGGAHPLTSKAGIVAPSTRTGVDLEFLFAQIQPSSTRVDTTANCGNMLAAVVPFAIESGLLEPGGDTATARVITLNTGLVAEITVPTPSDGQKRFVEYSGDARIDGVPGTAAPVEINFLDTAGSVCNSLLPTGNLRDTVDIRGLGAVDVTCIDNGMPLVIIQAAALERTGYESVDDLNRDTELKTKLEDLRISCGKLMGLGDVTDRNYPKMTLVSPPKNRGAINTRSFIPHVCHQSIGVLAAVTAATAAVLKGTVAHDIATFPDGTEPEVSVEHPSGEFTVKLGLDPANPAHVMKSALLRTARLVMAGNVMVPLSLRTPTDTATPPSSASQEHTQ